MVMDLHAKMGSMIVLLEAVRERKGLRADLPELPVHFLQPRFFNHCLPLLLVRLAVVLVADGDRLAF